MQFKELPVNRHKQEIIKALRENQVIVVESPTGTGKTTQLPQILYEEGYGERGIIGVTQPRRIATLSVTDFIAKQIGTNIPNIVGYKMRFEDMTDITTKIKIMTDGILLQELKTDYNLSNYSVIMVDEAHERSLNIDFILGFLKRILRLRKNFRVVVSSATINARIFSEYFDDCPIVTIDSRAYPVETIYTPPEPENNYDAMMHKITQIVSQIIKNREDGDILIFLSGEKAIKECIMNLYNLGYNDRIQLLPLYARLSVEEQEKVFLRYPGKRKIIVATNIAETSVTIDGITSVIDSGLAKINYYNPRNFTSSLIETTISRASCNQRKGRAGRTRPGKCYRLYTEKDYEQRPLFTVEEIYRTDLSEVVLRMAEIGIKDFERFNFISPPGEEKIRSAVETLTLLDAIDEDRNLTDIGKIMVKFPILPKHSRMIVEAILHYPNVIDQVTTAAAFLSTKTPFLLPQGEEIEARKAHHYFSDSNGDFYSYLKLLKSYRKSKNKEKFCNQFYLDLKTMQEISNIKDQLSEIVSAMEIPILSNGSTADYLCAVSRGLIQTICISTGKGVYRSITASRIHIHPGSVMFRKNPQYIVAGEVVKTSRLFARSVSPLKEAWLGKIHHELVSDLKSRKSLLGARAKDRDYTNRIKIGNEIFPIEQGKGKRKVAVMDFERIKEVMEKTNPEFLPNYKRLKGKVVFKGYELMAGKKLNTVLNVVKKIEPQEDITKWPKGKNFKKNLNSPAFITACSNILQICTNKKKGKRAGFLTLETDGLGKYWFRCRVNYLDALSISLSSLEFLADESEILTGENLQRINNIYRKLSIIFET